MEKLWNGNFNLGDFVMIICEIPFGLYETDFHTPYVKGRLGIITEVSKSVTYENDVCFRVKDEKGDEYTYAKYELIPAFEVEIRRVLKELLERR